MRYKYPAECDTPECRLWSRVDIRGDDDCWKWTGASLPKGYGILTCGGLRHYTHRLAYETCIGPIPTGLEVLHTCDNPPCVNPRHLFVGTQADNTHDMMAKGRKADLTGLGWVQKLVSALSSNEKESIRSEYADYFTVAEIALRHDVPEHAVRLVCGSGKRKCSRRLSRGDAAEVIELYGTGEYPQASLAVMFGVSPSYICRIVNGYRGWTMVTRSNHE